MANFQPARSTDDRLLVGASLWVVSTVLLLSEIPAILGWAADGGYDLTRRAISDLGATTCTTVNYADGARAVCSPRHGLVNASWVLSGLCLAMGAILVRPWLPGRAGGAAAVAFVLGGASVLATGLVPVDVDLNLHLLVALPSFLAINLALLLAAGALGSGPRPLRVCAVVLGVLGLGGGILVGLWAAVGGPLGIYERICVYAGPVWVLVAGLIWGRQTLERRRSRTAS